MINEGLDYMKQDYHKIREEDPAKALTLLIKLLEFSVPKLKSVDMKMEGEIKNQIEKLQIEVIQRENKDGSKNKDQ